MSEKKKRAQENNKLEISGENLKQYLETAVRSQADLAHLLNVTAGTVYRWCSEKKPTPSGAEFLALLPLLVSSGVDILHQPSDVAFESFINSYREFLDPKILHDQKTKAAMKRRYMLRSSPEMRAARRLFNELAVAWSQIEKDAGIKPGAPWPE
jgi:DNA-binding transcriptional regulator YiaG